MATSISSNEVYTPFRFHASQRLQNRNKKACQGACEYHLVAPHHYLLDFMIIREGITGIDPTLFEIHSLDGTESYVLDPASISLVTFNSFEYLIYNGMLDNGYGVLIPNYNSGLETILTCGKAYYVKVGDGTTTWWSETFVATSAYYDEESDVIINGTFDTDLSGWIVGTNWAWSGGKAVKSIAAVGQYLIQQINDTRAHFTYVMVRFTLSDCNFDIVGSSVTLVIDGQNYQFKEEGTHTVIARVGSFYDLYFSGSNKWTGSVDSVSLLPCTAYLDCHLCLEWYSDCSVGNMLGKSNTGITNRYFFPAEANVVDPDYKIIEDGKEDGDKNFVPTFQKRIKTITLETGLVPEYVVDALFDSQLHSTILLHYKNGLGYDSVEDMTVKYSWEFNEGCRATVELSLDINDRIVKHGCCTETDSLCYSYCVEVLNDLSRIASPTVGQLYVKAGNAKPITYVDGTNDTDYTNCDSAQQQSIVGISTRTLVGSPSSVVLGYYHYDSVEGKWVPSIHVSIVSVDAGLIQNTASTEFVLSVLPTSATNGHNKFAVFYSLDGLLTQGLGTYSRSEILAGITIDLGQQEFWIYVLAQSTSCQWLNSAYIHRRIGQAIAYVPGSGAFNWTNFNTYVSGGVISPAISNADPQDIVDYLNANYGAYEYTVVDAGGGVFYIVGVGLDSAKDITISSGGGTVLDFQIYDLLEITYTNN